MYKVLYTDKVMKQGYAMTKQLTIKDSKPVKVNGYMLDKSATSTTTDNTDRHIKVATTPKHNSKQTILSK
jgi:hypothetical protein